MILVANTYKALTPQCVSAFLALQNRVVNQATSPCLFKAFKARSAYKRY